MKITFSGKPYGVLCTHKDGTKFLASSRNSVVFSSYQRDKADRFAKELRELGITCRVRKIRITVEVGN